MAQSDGKAIPPSALPPQQQYLFSLGRSISLHQKQQAPVSGCETLSDLTFHLAQPYPPSPPYRAVPRQLPPFPPPLLSYWLHTAALSPPHFFYLARAPPFPICK